MFVFVLLCIFCVHSSFAICLKRKRKLVALLLLSYRFIFTINVLWFFLTVPWVGLQCVIMVYPDHTHLLFYVCSLFCCALLGVFSNLLSSRWGRERWLLYFNCPLMSFDC